MSKRFFTMWLTFVFLLISSTALAAEGGGMQLNWSEFGATALYGVLGVALALLGYFIFDLVTPFSVRKELTEDDNIAVGIVVGAMFLGVSVIVAAAII